MRLTELEPEFLHIEASDRYARVDDLGSSHGIVFLCPKCLVDNGGERPGVHSILCWFANRGVPAELEPGPGRWTAEGTGYSDLTFQPQVPGGMRSVQITDGCRAHFHVTAGVVDLC